MKQITETCGDSETVFCEMDCDQFLFLAKGRGKSRVFPKYIGAETKAAIIFDFLNVPENAQVVEDLLRKFQSAGMVKFYG